MNLDQWLKRIESFHPQEIEMGLGRVALVAQRLPLTKIANRVICVAGTNGKGTTIELIAEVLATTGLRVGCYTSPHLLRFNERIKIDSKPVGDSVICDAFARIDKARGDTALTYFEFSTLAAFDIFARADLDIALLEVGLGGRLDATNIVDSDIAVITSIALDHQDWLGDTRETIGYEKAGIMRAGAPVICGDDDPPLSLIHHAESLAADLDCIGQQYGYELVQDEQGVKIAWNWWGENGGGRQKWDHLPIPEIPIENAATALQVLMRLRLPIDRKRLCEGIINTRLLGRYQRLAKPIPIILDVAHNPHAAEYLKRRLSAEPVAGKVYALVAMMADKDYQKVIEIMSPVIDRWNCCDLPVPRALAATKMSEALRQQGIAAQEHTGVAEALQQLSTGLTGQDLLVIFGSFHTVSGALEYFGEGGSRWMTG